MKKRKAGYTIFEVVIAMAVIMAVSASAIICINSFSSASSYMLTRNEALTTAENALEGFKFANSLSEFDSLTSTFSSHFFTKEAYEEPTHESDGAGGYIYTAPGHATYSLVNAHYTLRISVTYNMANSVAVCFMSVVDDHGVTIYSLSGYTKAVIA